jgi:hypothetical protein
MRIFVNLHIDCTDFHSNIQTSMIVQTIQTWNNNSTKCCLNVRTPYTLLEKNIFAGCKRLYNYAFWIFSATTILGFAVHFSKNSMGVRLVRRCNLFCIDAMIRSYNLGHNPWDHSSQSWCTLTKQISSPLLPSSTLWTILKHLWVVNHNTSSTSS